jgi:hypothetical protein
VFGAAVGAWVGSTAAGLVGSVVSSFVGATVGDGGSVVALAQALNIRAIIVIIINIRYTFLCISYSSE